MTELKDLVLLIDRSFAFAKYELPHQVKAGENGDETEANDVKADIKSGTQIILDELTRRGFEKISQSMIHVASETAKLFHLMGFDKMKENSYVYLSMKHVDPFNNINFLLNSISEVKENQTNNYNDNFPENFPNMKSDTFVFATNSKANELFSKLNQKAFHDIIAVYNEPQGSRFELILQLCMLNDVCVNTVDVNKKNSTNMLKFLEVKKEGIVKETVCLEVKTSVFSQLTPSLVMAALHLLSANLYQCDDRSKFFYSYVKNFCFATDIDCKLKNPKQCTNEDDENAPQIKPMLVVGDLDVKVNLVTHSKRFVFDVIDLSTLQQGSYRKRGLAKEASKLAKKTLSKAVVFFLDDALENLDSCLDFQVFSCCDLFLNEIRGKRSLQCLINERNTRDENELDCDDLIANEMKEKSDLGMRLKLLKDVTDLFKYKIELVKKEILMRDFRPLNLVNLVKTRKHFFALSKEIHANTTYKLIENSLDDLKRILKAHQALSVDQQTLSKSGVVLLTGDSTIIKDMLIDLESNTSFTFLDANDCCLDYVKQRRGRNYLIDDSVFSTLSEEAKTNFNSEVIIIKSVDAAEFEFNQLLPTVSVRFTTQNADENSIGANQTILKLVDFANLHDLNEKLKRVDIRHHVIIEIENGPKKNLLRTLYKMKQLIYNFKGLIKTKTTDEMYLNIFANC